MLTAYAIVSRRLVQLQPEAGTDWLSRSSWIDLVAPSAAERDADDLEDAIDGLAEQEDLVGKVRLCLMDGQRDLKFLYRQRSFLPEPREWLTEMLGDIETLLPHNAFLSEKADFLLNTAQGFLNIEQSQIMKIFSIVALVFLPPTLIAAIYGMNFRLMPELDWPWGYPLALGLMVVAGISPYLYFKHKGWF